MSAAIAERPTETVWKYPLSIVDMNELKVPHGAQFLHVGVDPAGDLCLWARVNTSSPEIPARVYVVGTAYPYVWHVFTTALAQTLVRR
jgi:hypothetical protein